MPSKPSMRRQTNNVSRLPLAERLRVYGMLLNGATYDKIREAIGNDKLHNNSLKACQRSVEFQSYRAENSAYVADTMRDSLRAAVRQNSEIDLSVLAEEKIFKQIQSMIDDVEGTQDIKALSGALKDLAAIKKDRTIKTLEIKLGALEIRRQNEVAALESTIAKLSSGQKVDGALVAAEIRQILGVTNG